MGNDYLRKLAEGTTRELLEKLDAQPQSKHFEVVRAAIYVRMAEDLEEALDRASRASRGLQWALLAATAVGALATVVGAFAAFG